MSARLSSEGNTDVSERSEELARAADRATDEAAADSEQTTVVDPHEDRTREMRTPGFSRMRTDWHSHDAAMMGSIIEIVESRVMVNFGDVYQIMNDLYDLVRQPKIDPQSAEIITDKYGWPIWEQTDSGRYIEDWSMLGHKQRDTYLMEITSRMVDWEQRAADAWGEAMFAKAQWEERFSLTFQEDTGSRQTDEMRTQRARSESREERYFAIFQSLYSRKADALVRSMERLSQRLKDTLE